MLTSRVSTSLELGYTISVVTTDCTAGSSGYTLWLFSSAIPELSVVVRHQLCNWLAWRETSHHHGKAANVCVSHTLMYWVPAVGKCSSYQWSNQSGLTHKCRISPRNVGILSNCTSEAAKHFKNFKFLTHFVHRLHFCAIYAISRTVSFGIRLRPLVNCHVIASNLLWLPSAVCKHMAWRIWVILRLAE